MKKWEDAVMIAVTSIEPDPLNPNLMGDDDFNQLVEEIDDDGFDEPLQVVEIKDKEGIYRIRGGEHRWRAAKVLGLTELPCVVKPDEGDVVHYQKMVRRNLVRGELDRVKFSKLIQSIQAQNNVNEVAMREGMGFHDQATFEKMLVRDKAQQGEKTSKILNETKKEVQMVDNVNYLLNEIFTQYGCFPPETMVEHEDGPRRIEDIKVGDKVVNAEGVLEPVVNTFHRQHKGDLIELKVLKDRTPIRLTPNHEVFVIKPTNKRAKKLNHGARFETVKIAAADLGVGDWLMLPRFAEIKGSASIEIEEVYSWQRDEVCSVEECENTVVAKGYCSGHYQRLHRSGDPLKSRKIAGVSVKERCSVPGCDLTVRAKGLCARHYPGDERRSDLSGVFRVDKSLAFLVGAYIAEGCSGNSGSRFSLGIHEKSFARRILDAAWSVFGLVGSVYKCLDKSTLIVHIPSPSLAAWFEGNCGKHAENKRIPTDALTWPDSLLRWLVIGLTVGDGTRDKKHRRGGKRSLSMRSRTVIEQMRRVLLRLGYCPSVSYVDPKKSISKKRMYRVDWWVRPRQRYYRVFDKFFAIPIKDIRKVSYEGVVHNLEVDVSHSYQVRGVAVGNSTIPDGWIFFAYKNRMHLMLQCEKPLYDLTNQMAPIYLIPHLGK